MNTGHVNHAAERAFWLGQKVSPESNSVATADPDSAVASRPDRSELPSDGPAGAVHPCQREL